MPQNGNKTSEAQIKASTKWNTSKDAITLRIPKEVGAVIRNAAATDGLSVTQYILEAVACYETFRDREKENTKHD